MAITITNYEQGTGCVYFEIVGEILTGVYLQISTDNMATFDEYFVGPISPRCGYFITETSQFRIRHPLGTLSNIYEHEVLPALVVTRTPIATAADISFCNSPIHVRLQNIATDSTIKSATVSLFIWNGAINQTLSAPNHVLFAEKVSVQDDYINFEISEFIKSFLINPDNAPNTNQPQFAYNEIGLPAITGQGVFWQVVADVESTTGIERFNFRTSFCTLGYKFEDEKVHSATLPAVDLWHNPKIHDYFTQAFDFTKTLSTATSSNVIAITPFTPTLPWLRESLDPCLIVFLNKLGLWQTFTPDGKVVVVEKKKMSVNNIGYRDPSRVDTSYMHLKISDNFDVETEITVNTGSLVHEMVSTVRQIVMSPKIYLIRFAGDLQVGSTIGITIDNTFITVDTTLTTIDGLTVTSEYVNQLKTHTQTPVILTDTDFVTKTRLNDKNKIDYNLKFEKTTNAILDIR